MNCALVGSIQTLSVLKTLVMQLCRKNYFACTVLFWFKQVPFSLLKSKVFDLSKILCSKSKNGNQKKNFYAVEFASWHLAFKNRKTTVINKTCLLQHWNWWILVPYSAAWLFLPNHTELEASLSGGLHLSSSVGQESWNLIFWKQTSVKFIV